jgi:hypothetical protein
MSERLFERADAAGLRAAQTLDASCRPIMRLGG